MSQFNKTVDNIHCQWGFDRLAQGYFLSLDDLSSKEEDSCLYSVSSYYSLKPHPDFKGKENYSNGEILSIIAEEKLVEKGIIPQAHVDKIALDLPF